MSDGGMNLTDLLIDEVKKPHPLEYVEYNRINACRDIDEQKQKELGQFLTPIEIANYMSSMFGNQPNNIHLLDPGAGVGSLTASFIYKECSKENSPNSISATLIEKDSEIVEHLKDTMKICEKFCDKKKCPA
jgi:adenine-specific DNA-methyltransferase